MIFTKSTFSKKYRKKLHFGIDFRNQKNEKSRKKSVEKHAFFEHRLFRIFWRFFVILDGFWEARDPRKIKKKIEKIVFGALLERVFDFGAILTDFWIDFEWLLDGFGLDFGKIFA